MTGSYHWNPMRHKLDVRCPSCGSRADFEFAEVSEISLKKDIPFFENSDLFEYRLFQGSGGSRWHGAIFYAGLHGGNIAAIRDLPDGYSAEDWSHPGYLHRRRGEFDPGSVNCATCHFRNKHVLAWPDDAYFSIEYRGQRLWAFNRETLVELRHYIAGNERDADGAKWRSFLLHIPSAFKRKKARDQVVKQLDQLLHEAAD